MFLFSYSFSLLNTVYEKNIFKIKLEILYYFRLAELQQAMVGGEMKNNEEVKERRRKRKRHAEERKNKLAGL